MMNLRKKAGNNKGFSLVELIIVIAILAILVGVLAPQYIKYVEKSRKSTDAANIDSFVGAVKVAVADTDYNNGATPPVAINLLGKTYKITINKAETKVTEGSAGTAASTDLDAAFNEAIGTKWKGTKMKSSGWTSAGTGGGAATAATEISATVVVGADGSVTTTIAPTELASYMG